MIFIYAFFFISTTYRGYCINNYACLHKIGVLCPFADFMNAGKSTLVVHDPFVALVYDYMYLEDSELVKDEPHDKSS